MRTCKSTDWTCSPTDHVICRPITKRCAMPSSAATICYREQEQMLLRALGVFVGRFDRQAVNALGFAEATVQALVNKSLVQIEPRAQPNRAFYCWRRCAPMPGSSYIYRVKPNVDSAHAAYFLGLAALNDAAFRGLGSRTALANMDREAANLYAALVWALANDMGLALPLLAYLLIYWSTGRYSQMSRRWVETAVSQIQPEPTLPYADFLYGLALLRWHQAAALSAPIRSRENPLPA
ncbi:MAG: hypothetical protein R3E79_25590 [Caldilineaceae bacterium]